MISRQTKTFNVYVRQDGLDGYGQRLGTETLSSKSINMSLSIFTQKENYLNPIYKEVTHFGLTSDKTLEEGMIVSTNGIRYNVVLINKDTKRTQVFLTEVR